MPEPWQRSFVEFLLLDAVFGFSAGFLSGTLFNPATTKKLWPDGCALPMYALSELLSAMTTLAALVKSGSSFGHVDLPRGRWHLDLLAVLSLTTCVSLIILAPLQRCWIGPHEVVPRGGVGLITLTSCTLGLRGWPMVVLAAYFMTVGFLPHGQITDRIPLLVKLALVWFACSRTRYLSDQRRVAVVVLQSVIMHSLGVRCSDAFVADEPLERSILLGGAGGLVVIYLNLLLRRRHRYLPPGLAKAKFVRLGYLREMAARGETIRRCQELPERAFGDPAKAAYLVVVSHRWLDRHKNDLPTEEYPLGLKLSSLVDRLEAHFSPGQICGRRRRGCQGADGLRRWLSRAHAGLCLGGWDVVIFFDFMSLPQEGIDADGAIIPRTPDEQAAFVECLPSMGTLYSLFPVLVLSEVPQGGAVHGYMESGWCFCEFTIAALGKQLDIFSRRAQVGEEWFRRGWRSMCSKDAESFMECVSDEIAPMHFMQEADRLVALGIIQSFLWRRLLVDSIHSGKMSEVKRCLDALMNQGLESALHEPVDAGLNTVLHIAVRARQPVAVSLLLQRGARPCARNSLGDAPTQWLALPRLGAAAAACRAGPPKEELPVSFQSERSTSTPRSRGPWSC